MTMQRIEEIARENNLDGRHGARHLMVGFDVMDALKARSAGLRWAPEGIDALLSIPVIVADEGTLRADVWQLRENHGRAVVEQGWISEAGMVVLSAGALIMGAGFLGLIVIASMIADALT